MRLVYIIPLGNQNCFPSKSPESHMAGLAGWPAGLGPLGGTRLSGQVPLNSKILSRTFAGKNWSGS